MIKPIMVSFFFRKILISYNDKYQSKQKGGKFMIRYFKRLFRNLLSVLFLAVGFVYEVIGMGALLLMFIIDSFIDLNVIDKIENYILKLMSYPLTLIDKLIYEDEIEICKRMDRVTEDIRESMLESFDCDI